MYRYKFDDDKKDFNIMEQFKFKLICPGCKSKISNIEDLELYKKYKCTKCGMLYFIVKSPKESYLQNS